MTCTHCRSLLSAYIDESLIGPGRQNLGEGDRDRAAVEAHMHACADCRSLAEDLRRIRSAASSLEPLIPPARVWHQIVAATAAQSRGGWFQLGWPAWRSLTAMAMTAVIAAGLWRVGTLLGPATGTGPNSQVAISAPVGAADAEADFTDAIARLEQVTNTGRDVLDQDTAVAFNAGLTVIDRAINESRTALQDEPLSESAQESLYAALRRKVALLQETIALTNEMRKGNQ